MRISLVPPVILVGTLSVTACGDKSGPMAPMPTVTNLTVNGAEAVLTGFSSVYTATATRSDGSTGIVTATWTSAGPSIATIDAAGRLTGSRHGLVGVTASFQGVSATKTISVVNRYGGSWEGTFVVRRCAGSGLPFPGGTRSACAAADVGSVHKVDLDILSQGGQDLSQVSGQLWNWSISIDGQILGWEVTGEVTRDGGLILTGDLQFPGAPGWRWTVSRWETQLISPYEMRGQWVQDETSPADDGRHWEYELVALTNRYPGGRP